MIRERYYYAVAAFMRKDGKLTYTSVTSSVKGEEKDIVFYPIMNLITDVEEKFKDDMVSGTTLIHSVIEISKEDYDAYNDRITKINEKDGYQMTFLNITIGEKEFDEIKEGKVGLVCLPCTPRWCHTLVDGVKREGRLEDLLTARLDSNGKPYIQYGYTIEHYFKKVDYVQLSCKVGSQIRVLVKDCAGFSIETTQTKKDNGFVEFKPKNFVVHLK